MFKLLYILFVTLNFLSRNQSHKLEKSLNFSTFLCWTTVQVAAALSNESLTTAWASHLCKAKTGVVLEWILRECHILG